MTISLLVQPFSEHIKCQRAISWNSWRNHWTWRSLSLKMIPGFSTSPIAETTSININQTYPWSLLRKAFFKSDQGHAWSTFIEAVSATGEVLNPGIIFKDKDLQAQWFLQEFQEIAPWHFICSENGWTSNEIAISWLKEVYLPQTTLLLHDESEARLLILDGHKSHTSVYKSQSYW